jgi:outer membrane protein OmpA-like peptidoglycan-associated protein
MAKDWASDVKKFVPDADDGVIAGIVRYCGIALQKPDSSLVSYGDPVELGRVRNNFLKKKLALTDSDDVLDAAIARVGERMKGVNFKNRVTVYYLLLEDLGLLHLFAKKGTAAANGTSGVAAGVAAAGAAAVTAAAPAAPVVKAEAPKPVAAVAAAPLAVAAVVPAASIAAPAPVARAPIGLTGPRYGLDGRPWIGWLWAALLGFGLIALFLLIRPMARTPMATLPAAPAAPVTPDAPTAVATPTPAATAVPVGAGIVSETREAKPVVKVYFDTGKAVVAPTFAAAAEPLKAYLAANPAAKIAVSGFNDPTGNAAANAALSKRRAQAVQAQLVAAGIPAASIELIKPAAATDTVTTAAEARRVEAYIK